MKIQCSCGAKYAFDISPEMARNPVQFVCPACGLDGSEFVNNLVGQKLGAATASAPAPAPAAMPSLAPTSVHPVPPSPPAARLRIQAAAVGKAEVAPLPADGPQLCLKHPGQLTTDKCFICSKPICPKCKELFGYVCSPLCKAKAESHGVEVPVFQGQKSIVEARLWRRTGRITGAVCGAIVAVLGLWFWYAWFGSAPKVTFSARFGQPAYSGQSAFAGTNQIVFLHGDTLARHDMKVKREIWSRRLIDQQLIDAQVAKTMKENEAVIFKANNEAWEHVPKMPSAERLADDLEKAAAAALELRVHGQNIWVMMADKLVRYDWDTGKPTQEILLPARSGGLMTRGDELLMVEEADSGKQVVTRINLTTCDSRTVEIGAPSRLDIAAAGNNPDASAKSGGGVTFRKPQAAQMAGLPLGMPGKDAGKPLDPAKVAAQAQHLSYPARIALPAVLANNMNQERTLGELSDLARRRTPPALAQPEAVENSELIPTQDGFVQFSTRLLESRVIQRSAMKAAPGKSAVAGAMTVAKTGEVANEILNEMQRSRGGDVVEEDQSRYLVTLRRPGAKEAWSGEVIGAPTLFALQTVNVLAANKTILVFDKAQRKLWQSSLNYNLSGGPAALGEDNARYGQGPCVEHNGALYVIDEGVLTAFDLATGNARWRLPSIGIAGLFFDDKGMVYVNTTTAGPQNLKYSRQIDISERTSSVVFKIDPRSGKILWSTEPGGMVAYVSGKSVYVVQSYRPDEGEQDPYQPETGFERLPFLRIKRINPKNGRQMWEHFEQRAPVDAQFDKNSIRLIFKREVQVLRFLAL